MTNVFVDIVFVFIIVSSLINSIVVYEKCILKSHNIVLVFNINIRMFIVWGFYVV